MDTHIPNAPDGGHAGVPLPSPIRLPGARDTLPHSEAPDDIAGVQSHRPPHVAVVAPQRRRRRLLGTVATLALLAGSADAVWLHRHDIVNLPWPASMTTALQAGEARLRPQLASWLATLRATALQAAAALPTPQRAVAAPAPATPAEAEFASLKPDEGQPAATAAQAGANPAKPPAAPAEIGVATAPADAVRPARPSPAIPASIAMPPTVATPSSGPSRPDSQQSTAAASPATAAVVPDATSMASAAVPFTAPPGLDRFWTGAYFNTARFGSPPGPDFAPIPSPPAAVATAASPPSPLAVPKPRDAVEAATKLLAAPLAPKQQVEVVGFVRELGAQLGDTRTTVAQLKDTVSQLKEEMEKRSADFDSRLSFAEAGSALMQSAKAGERTKPAWVAASPAIHPVALTQSVAAVPASRAAKEFRIQGASPGLVVLNALDPAAGEEPVLYKALGDQVPGLGRIKAIYQRGTRWVVQTEGGLIQ